MKVNKVFGVKSITNLIYGMLLLLPMVSIFSRIIYTQSNPNAMDSYTQTSVRQATEIQQSSFISNTNYQIEYVNNNINTNSSVFGFSSSSIDYEALGFPDLTYNGFQIIGTNGLLLANEEGQFTFKNNVWGITLKSFDAVLTTYTQTTTNFKVIKYLYTNQTLDNSFEYSLSTFLEDYDNDGVDFFSWFTNLFLNQSNQHNALYLNFCNWYMNYVLLVSSAYLLFFALIWFINYIRKLLEKSSYHDFGGF